MGLKYPETMIIGTLAGAATLAVGVAGFVVALAVDVVVTVVVMFTVVVDGVDAVCL